MSGLRQRHQFFFESMIDEMLLKPSITAKELALKFDRSPKSISLILSSDMFRARFAQRRETVNKEIAARILGTVHRIAEASLDVVEKTITENPAKLSFSQVTELAKDSLQILGYGAPKVPAGVAGVNVTVNTTGVERAVLEEARAALRATEKTKLLEATPNQVFPNQAETPFEGRQISAPLTAHFDVVKDDILSEIPG